MAQVLDCSYSYPGAQAIADYGAAGTIRYLSWQSSKNWHPDQIQSHQDQGLAVGAVWETTASRANAGWQAGNDDAGHANDQADALGWPADRPLYYAVDSDSWAWAVRPYFEGAVSRGRRPVGIYAQYDIIESLVGGGLLQWGWQTAAWSGNGSGSGGSIQGRRLSQHACLFQRVGYVLNQTCDANDILKPDWGQWGAGTEQPTVRIPETMHRLVMTDIRGPDGATLDNGPSWLLTGGFKRWLPSTAYYDILHQAAVDLDPFAEVIDVGHQSHGSRFIALLDLATLQSPDSTPQSVGGNAPG